MREDAGDVEKSEKVDNISKDGRGRGVITYASRCSLK